MIYTLCTNLSLCYARYCLSLSVTRFTIHNEICIFLITNSNIVRRIIILNFFIFISFNKIVGLFFTVLMLKTFFASQRGLKISLV